MTFGLIAGLRRVLRLEFLFRTQRHGIDWATTEAFGKNSKSVHFGETVSFNSVTLGLLLASLEPPFTREWQVPKPELIDRVYRPNRGVTSP